MTSYVGIPAEAKFDEGLIDEIAERAAKLVLNALRDEPENWVKSREAAAHLHLTLTAFYQRNWKNHFPAECSKKIGGSLRWNLAALDRIGLKKRNPGC
jgi:hypothetical protein